MSSEKIADVIKALVKKGMSIDDAAEIAIQVVEDKKTQVSKTTAGVNHPSGSKKTAGGAGAPSSKLKTQMCKFYGSSKGCSNGDNCKFAHGSDELR